MATPGLSDKIKSLIEIISKEVSVFEDFLALLGRQQEKVAQNDAVGLKKVTERQREKVVESQILNKLREDLISDIKSANVFEGDLNVSRLIELVDEDQGNRLMQLGKTINGLITQITEVRNHNANLLDRSGQYIARTLNLLSKINSPIAKKCPSKTSFKKSADVLLD